MPEQPPTGDDTPVADTPVADGSNPDHAGRERLDEDLEVSWQEPVREHHHRSVQGGAARAAVFGVSDGLVSNVSLILGVAGASPGADVVRLAGIAGLLAGAISMAAGEWVSMKAQQELLERELEMEKREIHRVPHVEQQELTQLYQSRGIPADVAREMAEQVHRDPELALEVHAREELGMDPEELGNPLHAAGSSFGAFAIGAIVPLLPWFFAGGMGAVVVSLVLSGIAAAAVGGLLARFTDRPPLPSMVRQVVIAGVAAGVTYAIGSLIGVSVA